ncbi:MAG: heme-binding protein [Thermohalobaculum sp.]|nr:heme-binding protein [Thermohalobaculum sp.]
MGRVTAMAGALLAGLVLAGCSVVGGKAAEEPAFRLIAEEGDFQIRAYPALTVARTVVAGEDRGPAVREGFGRLFDYIRGANTGQAEIAMTAPVLTAPAGETIAMTAPVLSAPAGGGWETVFVLPDGMTPGTAPRPTDPAVEIVAIPPREVAVVTFSGVLGHEAITRERARLEAWLAARGQAHRDDWQAAGYNPPWTIPAYRRNEVIVSLVAAGG